MARDSRQKASEAQSAGDAAVDGLIFGAIAGAVMGAYLLLAGLAWGDSLTTTLGHFDPGQAASPVAGLFTHLAVSAVYGALFALGWRFVARVVSAPVWVAGAIYGLLLWALAANLFISSTASQLQSIPPFHFAVAHGIYGFALGLGLARRK